MPTPSTPARPQIKIPLQPLDYALEIVAAMSLVALLGLVMVHYADLPEQIPTHFGADGRPDGFGSKNSLWLLPVLGLFIYAMMTFINQKPHVFNYTVKITPENAPYQYRMGVRLIRFLKATILILFAYLVWGTINIATGGGERLGHWLWLLPVLSIGSVFYFFLKSSTNK